MISLYKFNLNCHFLTLKSYMYILSKTDLDYGCSTVLHLHLLRVEEQEEIHYWNDFYMCLHMRMTPQWIYVQCTCMYKKWRNLSMTLHDYPFVAQRYRSFTTNGFYFWAIIASPFWTYLRNFARPYSCWDSVVTHTDRHKLTTISLHLRSG